MTDMTRIVDAVLDVIELRRLSDGVLLRSDIEAAVKGAMPIRPIRLTVDPAPAPDYSWVWDMFKIDMTTPEPSSTVQERAQKIADLRKLEPKSDLWWRLKRSQHMR